MQQHYFPNTITMQMGFLKGLENTTSKLQLGIMPHGEKQIGGVISLGPIDWINRHANISILIGESKYRRLGLSHEAMRLVIEHAFYTLNLHRVYVGYLASLRGWGTFMKRMFGFRDEGCRKEHAYKGGVYTDIYLLGLLRTDYKRKSP
jgi:RimJ/RimL family protein N-acetyltransferase